MNFVLMVVGLMVVGLMSVPRANGCAFKLEISNTNRLAAGTGRVRCQQITLTPGREAGLRGLRRRWETFRTICTSVMNAAINKP